MWKIRDKFCRHRDKNIAINGLVEPYFGIHKFKVAATKADQVMLYCLDMKTAYQGKACGPENDERVEVIMTIWGSHAESIRVQTNLPSIRF
jgi:hypothetical protein